MELLLRTTLKPSKSCLKREVILARGSFTWKYDWKANRKVVFKRGVVSNQGGLSSVSETLNTRLAWSSKKMSIVQMNMWTGLHVSSNTWAQIYSSAQTVKCYFFLLFFNITFCLIHLTPPSPPIPIPTIIMLKHSPVLSHRAQQIPHTRSNCTLISISTHRGGNHLTYLTGTFSEFSSIHCAKPLYYLSGTFFSIWQ